MEPLALLALVVLLALPVLIGKPELVSADWASGAVQMEWTRQLEPLVGLVGAAVDAVDAVTLVLVLVLVLVAVQQTETLWALVVLVVLVAPLVGDSIQNQPGWLLWLAVHTAPDWLNALLPQISPWRAGVHIHAVQIQQLGLWLAWPVSALQCPAAGAVQR